MNGSKYSVNVTIEQDGKGFHVYCPALKGLHVGGDNEREALGNAADAVILYLRSLERHGDPIPVGIEHTVSRRSLWSWLHRSQPQDSRELVLTTA